MEPQLNFGLGVFELVIVFGVFVLSLLITVLPFWMIFTKAGFPGRFSLAMLVPCLNVVLLFFLAFAEWPALRQNPTMPEHTS